MKVKFFSLLTVILLSLASSCFVAAADSPLTPVLQSHVFSYTLVEMNSADAAALESAADEIVALATVSGAVDFARWTPADKPADAPFAGLTDNQIVIMLAWPSATTEPLDDFNETLQNRDALRVVSSRLFEAIYLPEGLEVPTGAGFYVHREEKYSLENVSDAVRLSQEAWLTWEPHWGVKVIGLFRELAGPGDSDNLNRIVWYPSHAAWLETRNFAQEMESAARFRQRRTMLIPGSGVAIATDRYQP